MTVYGNCKLVFENRMYANGLDALSPDDRHQNKAGTKDLR